MKIFDSNILMPALKSEEVSEGIDLLPFYNLSTPEYYSIWMFSKAR